MVYASLVDLVLKDRDKFVISKFINWSIFRIYLYGTIKRRWINSGFWKKLKKLKETLNKR